MVTKPDWGISTLVGKDGRDHVVEVETVVKRAVRRPDPFQGAGPQGAAAPHSAGRADVGPLRDAAALDRRKPAARCRGLRHRLAQCPRHPGQRAASSISRITPLYLIDFMRALGPDTHVIAVCQPAPLALAATAYLAEHDPKAQPRTLTLIGGPIDPDAAADRRDRLRPPRDDGPAGRTGDPARRLQICRRRPHGLSRPAAACRRSSR